MKIDLIIIELLEIFVLLLKLQVGLCIEQVDFLEIFSHVGLIKDDYFILLARAVARHIIKFRLIVLVVEKLILLLLL